MPKVVTRNGQLVTLGGKALEVEVPDTPSITVDDALSSTSTNPVQNKVVTAALAEKITAPTTAAVGQIIKVKSVDTAGKPTEWEAADLDKDEYEVVAHVAITEDISAITIDKDLSGNNLNLDECVLFIYSVGGSGNTARSNAFLYLNNQNTAVQRKKISELLFAAGKVCQYTFHCKNMPYGYYAITPSKYDGYGENYANAITQFLAAGEKGQAESLAVNTIKPAGITSIHLYAETEGNTWGAGTWIIVQGKRRKEN